MSEMRAIKGLVLGSVAVLVGAVAVIMIQVAKGPGGLRVPEGGMVAVVPEGAVCLLHLDVGDILDTPLAQGMAKDPEGQAKLAEARDQVHSVDAFVLTPQAGSEAGDRPALCGVVRVGAETYKEFHDLMAKEGKRLTIGNASAYRVPMPRQSSLGLNVPGSAALFMAPAGTNTVAFATTRRGFEALAGGLAGSSSAGSQSLGEMATTAGSAPFWVAIDGQTAIAAAGERAAQMPDFLKDTRAALVSVAVDEDVEVSGLLRLASTQAAAKALAAAQAGLDQAKAQIEQGTAPEGVPVAAAAVVLNRTSLSASGSDVNATVVLTGEELGQMVGAVLMGALAAGMQAQPSP